MKKFIGIDNGLHGAIAILTVTEKTTDLVIHDMPVLKIAGKNKYDLHAIGLILKEHIKDSFAVLEQAQAMPGQGVVSMFSTGYGYGLMRGFLTALNIPYQIIPSQRWKKEYGLQKTEKKDAALPAEALYPQAKLRGSKGGVKDGRADALLLADYGKRFYGN
jgi:crossover junction endodeoxyribonuclease RuvC